MIMLTTNAKTTGPAHQIRGCTGSGSRRRTRLAVIG